MFTFGKYWKASFVFLSSQMRKRGKKDWFALNDRFSNSHVPGEKKCVRVCLAGLQSCVWLLLTVVLLSSLAWLWRFLIQLENYDATRTSKNNERASEGSRAKTSDKIFCDVSEAWREFFFAASEEEEQENSFGRLIMPRYSSTKTDYKMTEY